MIKLPDKPFRKRLFWIGVVVFSILLIPMQDIFKLICYIPYILTQERSMGFHIKISQVISYANGYVSPARVFDATFLGEASSIILTFILMVSGFYIYKRNGAHKELGLALSLTMIISRLLLYGYIAVFKLWLINDEGIMAIILHKNLYLFYSVFAAILLTLLIIILRNINLSLKHTFSFILTFIVVFIAVYEPAYLVKDILVRHDALRETYFWFYQFNKW